MALTPICVVRDGAEGPYVPTTNGADVSPGDTIYIKLVDFSAVVEWYLEVTGTDELSSSPSLTGVNPITHLVSTPSTEVSFTYPSGKGRAVLFQSTVTGTGGPLVTTFGVFSLTDLNRRVGAVGEMHEGNAAAGWATKTNPLLREVPRQETLASENISGDQALAAHLTQQPLNGGAVELYLNGVIQQQGADYLVSGTTITWLAGTGTAVPLDTSDVLVVRYTGLA